MGAVVLSEQAEHRLATLPAVPREEVSRRLDYLRSFPRMYAVTQDERFPGCRSFRVEPHYRVFYMVAAGGDDVYVAAIVEEEATLTLLE